MAFVKQPSTRRSALCLSVSGIAIALGPIAYADPYDVTLATPPAQVTNVNPNISINQTGNVAFVATDVTDGYTKVFVDPPCLPCVPQAVSFFGSGRDFYGVSINDASPPQVLASDNYSTYSFLRAWDGTGSGGFQLYGKTPDPFVIDFTGFGAIADNGAVVDLEVQSGGLPALGLYPAYGAARTLLGYPSGTLLRPQIAKAAGTVVATAGTRGVFAYTYNTASTAWAARLVPGTDGSAYTNVGSSPGISNDGSVIAFAGSTTVNGTITPQIMVELSHPGTIAAGAATVFEPAKPVVAEMQEGVMDLHDYVARRVSVYSRIGSPFLAGDQNPVDAGAEDPGRQEQFQIVTVMFTASVALNGGSPVEGVYSRDLLIQLTAGGNAAGSAYIFKVLRLGPITPVLTAGTTVSGVKLDNDLAPADTVANVTTGSQATSSADLMVPLVALTGADVSGKYYGFRGQRKCALPIPAALSALPNWKQNSTWGSHPMTGVDKTTLKPYTIGAVGCRLSAIADVMSYLAPTLKGITPDSLNQVLKQSHFQTTGGTLTVGTQGPDQLKKSGYDTEADVRYQGVLEFCQQAQFPVTHDEVEERVSSDGVSYVKTGPLGVSPEPSLQSNLNADGLSPYLDFLECNSTPPIVRVLNCKEYYSGTSKGTTVCKFHFVMGTGKSANSVKGESTQYVTSSISDPGYNGVKDLINTFMSSNTSGDFVANRHNRIAGIEAYFPVSTTPLPERPAPRGIELSNDDALTIIANSNTGQPLATMLATDPDGTRKIGVNGITGESFGTIPNAEYIGNDLASPSGLAEDEGAIEIQIGSPFDAYGNWVPPNGLGTHDGAYHLDVYGTASGTVLLTILSMNNVGQLSSVSASFTTLPGQHNGFTLSRTETAVKLTPQ
jgi:hypothetical protein